MYSYAMCVINVCNIEHSKIKYYPILRAGCKGVCCRAVLAQRHTRTHDQTDENSWHKSAFVCMLVCPSLSGKGADNLYVSPQFNSFYIVVVVAVVLVLPHNFTVVFTCCSSKILLLL